MKTFTKVLCFSVLAFLFSLTIFTPLVVSNSTSSVGQSIPRTPPGPNSFIGYYKCSSTVPCPEGIVDYGINKASSYSYHAVTFDSWANFTTLSIGTSSNSCNGCMTIQQNLVDYNVFEKGATITHSGSGLGAACSPNSSIWVILRHLPAPQHLELFGVSLIDGGNHLSEPSGELLYNWRSAYILLLQRNCVCGYHPAV